jgi:hypothetical protein
MEVCKVRIANLIRRRPERPHTDGETLAARLERECAQLAVIYRTEAEYGWDRDFGWWVCISNFPLPDGMNRSTARLIILVPPEYPAVAPSEFFVQEGLASDTGWRLSELLPGNREQIAPDGWRCCAFPETRWRDGDDLDRLLSNLQSVLKLAAKLQMETVSERKPAS